LVVDRNGKALGPSSILYVEAFVKDGVCVVANHTQSVVCIEVLQAKALAADLEENSVKGLWKDALVPHIEAFASSWPVFRAEVDHFHDQANNFWVLNPIAERFFWPEFSTVSVLLELWQIEQRHTVRHNLSNDAPC
jgi:hypothetical protein